MIDYGSFLTKPPPQVSGQAMIGDALGALARQRAEAARLQLELAQKRAEAEAQAQAQARAMAETIRAHQAEEAIRGSAQSEIGRHNLATEDVAKQTTEQRAAEATGKALMDPAVRSAMGGVEPSALDQLAPSLRSLGITVRPRQQGPDEAMPMAGSDDEKRLSNQRELLDSKGATIYGFDPARNAADRAARAAAVRRDAEAAAAGMNPFDAEGMRAGARVAASAASQGTAPDKALEAGQRFATSSAAQASSRRNTDIGASSRATSYASPDQREANPVNQEITGAVKDLLIKGGLKDQLLHSEAALKKLRENPNNPVEWTNAIDSMIRTATGKAAIKAQYDLYTSHAAGKVDSIDQFVEKLKSGLPSPEQQKNLLAAMRSSNAELRSQANEAYKNFRRYDEDPRVKRNGVVNEHYRAVERNVFGNMPGYGEGGGGKPANLPPGAVMGTLKGVRGYAVGGKFYPVEGGQ